MSDVSDLSETKAALRKQAFAVRKQAHAEAVGAAESARDHFLASRVYTGAAIISGYCPIRTEIDVFPLMTALHAAGHQICVPVIEGPGLPLAFREWWPGVSMEAGAFGAEVPVDTDVLTPDLLIAPLLLFDLQGWRLGYGGGFYDRTLELLRAQRRTRAYGFAYAAQQIYAVPTEPTDQRLDGIATECGLINARAIAA